jgi:nitrogen fixation protein NifU and related proteins
MEDQDIYQEFIIELYKKPLNHGRMAGADYHAELDNPTCGDHIELFIKAKNGVVADAKFTGQGCAISQASASLFTGYIKGKTLASLGKISGKDALKLIKIDLSKNPGRMRCALLPLEAMKKALAGK